MVQIHGKGRYIIIATKSILVLILGIPVGIGVSVVVHHRLVSISHRGGHSIGVSEGGGVGDGLDGLDHGGGVGHGLDGIVDIGSLMGIDKWHLSLVHLGIGLSLEVHRLVKGLSLVVHSLSGLHFGGLMRDALAC